MQDKEIIMEAVDKVMVVLKCTDIDEKTKLNLLASLFGGGNQSNLIDENDLSPQIIEQYAITHRRFNNSPYAALLD